MPPAHAPIFFVSKPLAAPWNDGSKNLARDLVEGWLAEDPSREAHAFVPRGGQAGGGGQTVGGVGGHLVRHLVSDTKLTRRTSLEMLRALAMERRGALWHFIFAPSARTRLMGRVAARLRGRASVQTIASMPAEGARLGDVVFADRVVVLSRASWERAVREGVSPSRLAQIPVAIPPPAAPAPERIAFVREGLGASGRLLVTFPGDLEHGEGARVLLDAVASMAARADVTLALACREKGPRSKAVLAELAGRAARAHVELRVVGETPDILALLAASDVVAMPTDTLYAKVDHPLVLLEAMHLGVAVLVSEGTSASELGDEGATVTPFSADAIAAELDRLASDTARREASGARARDAMKARSAARMVRGYEAIYAGLR